MFLDCNGCLQYHVYLLVFRKICVALVESENQRISELACLHQLFNLRATAAADGLLQGDVGENCEVMTGVFFFSELSLSPFLSLFFLVFVAETAAGTVA